MSASHSAASLPSRFPFQESQRELYAMWESRGYFHAEVDPNKKPYCIVIPPPNVTGALHLGHALNNTLQDILIRMKRMQGYAALWMPGTDHAGIATQAVVEKRLREEEGKTRHDLGREKLVERIWQWKDHYEARILGQLKQMGCSCDWERTRFTLDEVCARAVRVTFFDLFRQEKIYRGKRLVNWDTFLQTAVSDDEVFHETVQGHFWHIRYRVVDPEEGEPSYIVVATTRPETLLGDTAVAVHPDPGAAFDAAERELEAKRAAAPPKERPEIAAELERLRELRTERLEALQTLTRMAREGRLVELPLLKRPIPLITDEWAKPQMGTGCVKITPAHDPNDYEVGLRHQLPMINILRPDGTLNEHAGPYAGLTIAQARERVVADLEAQGLLECVEDREIDLAHSDRSKTPIEPYLADQWFVKMDELAQSAMDAVTDGRVEIIPPRYTKGYLDWLSEKRDWPVSRQLWWGHRIPIWSKRCVDDAERESTVAALKEDPDVQAGKVAWQVELPDARVGQQDVMVHVCIRDESRELEERFETLGFRREEDVLDTWFSSALWPHSTLGWPERTPELEYFYPTSVLVTSRDIITLWVARMVLMGLNNMGEVPFRQVFIHPKILDGYGETMSKSKGNGVDPIDVIEKFGADALRFGLARLTTQTQDVRMPVQFECPHCQALLDQTRENRQLAVITCPQCQQPFRTQWAEGEALDLPRGPVVSERFEMARNFSNKLWNAARLILMNLEGFEPAPVAESALELEDRWILSRLATVVDRVTEALDAYRFAEAATLLYDFAWDEFCSFYLELAKPRWQDADRQQAAQGVAAYGLDVLLRLLHPMMPFLTEAIWQHLNDVAPRRGIDAPAEASDSIMVAPWPTGELDGRYDAATEERFGIFQRVLGGLREIRSRQNIPPRKTVAFAVRCSAETASLVESLRDRFASLGAAELTESGPEVPAPPVHARIAAGDVEVLVDLSGVIDVDAERARNEKLKEQLERRIAQKESKLGNAKFVEKAPAEVVQRERESLEALRKELTAVEAALAALAGAGGAAQGS